MQIKKKQQLHVDYNAEKMTKTESSFVQIQCRPAKKMNNYEKIL